MLGNCLNGSLVRYIGPCEHPGWGSVGTFAWLQNYDLYSGEPLGESPGFVDCDGNAYYCDLDDLELI